MTTNSNQPISENSKITRKDFWAVFWHSLSLDMSWNFERMQNMGYAYMMTPIIRRLYGDDQEKRAASLKRHLEFMSCTPHIVTLLGGICGAMEEESLHDEHFDTSAISAVKASLMGPMAGIGDSFYRGTLKIIATGIGVSFAAQGNIAGAILYWLIINIPHFAMRYIFLDKGFKYGSKFFTDTTMNDKVEKITKAASVLGLLVIGSMIAQNVVFKTPLMIGGGQAAQPLQDSLDAMIPGLLPFAAFLIMYWLLGEGFKTTTILICLFVVSCIGCFLGIL